jgi:hypothetical protein
MTALILSTVLPYLVTKFGGMLVSSLMLKFGASQSVATMGANVISQIASKMATGKPLSDSEKVAWNTHFQATYQQGSPAKSVEVASAPGVPFVRL